MGCCFPIKNWGETLMIQLAVSHCTGFGKGGASANFLSMVTMAFGRWNVFALRCSIRR